MGLYKVCIGVLFTYCSLYRLLLFVQDRLLRELLIRNKDYIVKYHEQDSLLENQTGEELTEEERKAAWEDYENEKKGNGKAVIVELILIRV